MKILEKYNKIVIKVGSSILVDKVNNKIKDRWLDSLCQDIKELKKIGKKIIVVSSGAVALGKKYISQHKSIKKLEDKQAAAAMGQIELIQIWQKNLNRHKISTAQLLLTLDDSEQRKRYLNARKTINSLLQKDIVPVVNENDTVGTEEIRFGDNDRLAARVAQMMEAELLIILSETDGFYQKNPTKYPNAKKINRIRSINKRIEVAADNKSSVLGSGGMKTKIIAAKICTSSGCSMVVASGLKTNPIKSIDLRNSSWFLSKKIHKSARKQWIINHLNTLGEIQIDDGAVVAIKRNKSLLPAGIVKIYGKFNEGDAVEIIDKKGKKIAIGLSNYNYNDSLKIIGKKSQQIKKVLGNKIKEEFIHKDDLVIK